jgi:MFS family permease
MKRNAHSAGGGGDPLEGASLTGGSDDEEESRPHERSASLKRTSDDGGDADTKADADGGSALDAGGVIDIWAWHRIGYIAQYFAVGTLSGGLPATIYGLFLGYLNVPAYVYATAAVITQLPWSFKFFFGAVNDCYPIAGYRRKPYMVVGWCFAAFMLIVLAYWGLPPPYWCVGEDGRYITTRQITAHGNGTGGGLHAAQPCNASAAKAGGQYALLMSLACLGYIIADVAADGLTVTYARREPREQRGATQTTAYLVRSCGSVASILLVGFGMNGPEYNGTFDSKVLSFNQICGILAIPATAMIPISWYLVDEPRVSDGDVTFGKYCATTFQLLRSRAFFFIICFQFLSGAIGSIGTTAGGQIKLHWAGVENLQNQLFSLVGQLLFAYGLWLVKRHYLHQSWRAMLAVTTVFLVVIDAPFTLLTIYDVVRNQYFYLGETVLVEIPAAAGFVVSTFVIVEMAEASNGGLVYGLLTTTANLGAPVANAISVQLFGLFTPKLSDVDNYLQDTPHFRDVVALSMVLSYAFSLASLLLLPLLPDQKEDAQLRKRTWHQDGSYAVATIAIVALGLAYSLLVNMLSMFESTMCLKFAGGDGCDGEDGA